MRSAWKEFLERFWTRLTTLMSKVFFEIMLKVCSDCVLRNDCVTYGIVVVGSLIDNEAVRGALFVHDRGRETAPKKQDIHNKL